MKTPDLTPAQIISTLTAILGLFVTQGLVDNNTEKLIGGLASIVIPLIWQLADAIIRHGRSNVAAAVAANPNPAVSTAVVPPASEPASV